MFIQGKYSLLLYGQIDSVIDGYIININKAKQIAEYIYIYIYTNYFIVMVSMYTITQYISNICLGFNKEYWSAQKSQFVVIFSL